MAQSWKNDSGMVPRSYQLEILEDIKKSNTILYLPTGCGKTYIASLLIKHMGECLTKPIGNGRKWTFFIAQTVPLVSQQSINLRKHLPWNVGTFSGAASVASHSQKQWDQILEKYQILVMTAQIYLNNLYHGFMHIKDANLLIFDECHHAVAEHPFRKIMDVLHNSNLKSDDRPHILGLTATLINSKSKNVKDDLHKLQITFNSTIKTKYDKHIQNFSAHPEESVWLYDEYILDNELLVVTRRISNMVNYLGTIQDKPKTNYFKIQNKETSNQLENYFRDLEVQLNDGGAYIAYLNLLHSMVEIVRKQKICEDVKRSDIMSLVLSELTTIKNILSDYMNKHSIIHRDKSTKLQHVSPKVKKLMENISVLKATDACLVFVLRRTTAKTLCHYINDYIKQYNQKNIVCEFIVGRKGVISTDINDYKKLRNCEIIKRFNSNIINVLITSQVLEEGIDIQTCNVVIRYDCANNFTSYIQSKGRARSATSQFISMVPNSSIFKYAGTLDNFCQMEKDIKNALDNNKEDANYNFKEEHNILTLFKTMFGQASLHYENAREILNVYCMSLSEDQLLDLKEEWYTAVDQKKFYKCKLTLPINSFVKTTIKIDGIFCINKKDAKKKAAFNACIELYKIGALDEDLKPIIIENNTMQNYFKWFPHSDEKDIKYCKNQINVETHKIKGIVHSKSPTYLHGSYPQVNKPSYLHAIHCVPDYIQLKETNHEAFNKLLKSINEFGILTLNKLPQVSSFPIFSEFGIVNVSIKVNVNVHIVDDKILKKLENFHNKLFMDVLGVKNNVRRSYDNGDNSYLIVPISLTDNIYYLNYNVINMNKLVETVEQPTMEERNSKFNKTYLSSRNVISMWFKNVSPVQRYIITDVYMDKTPESSFKSSKYVTYAKYFSDNYNIQVSNKNQPLIKVMSLNVSDKNYLTPRDPLLDKQTKHDNILIPEFCTWHTFPSDYWLKALMLPTILYRLEKLLLAEELFKKINIMCNIVVEDNSNKDSLKMDSIFVFNENKIKKNVIEINETLKYTLNNMDEDLVFDPNNFPKDIERIKKPTISDLQNYQTFMYNQFEAHFNIELIDEVPKIELNDMNPLNLTNNPPPRLSPLIKEFSKQNIWPKQSDILKAITPPKAKDIFNYECMETFGDSFLKFATSLVLFDTSPLHNEGVLTILRTKIIGNEHLCYVGRNSNIASYMVNHFDPNTDWIPPCFSVPEKNKVDEILHKNNQITDKMVADCIESLIGTYVYKCGVEVGYKVLRGLGIIPEQLIDTIKPKSVENLRIDSMISKLLPGYKIFERRIGYSFKHKNLLVQALTHPTNEFGLSECYQRLEFLGDAIIDFLITSHIMEHGNTKTPAEITMIRSSLVNNTVIGSLSARIGLHRFVLAKSEKMTEAIDRFYKYFQKNNYQIDQDVLCRVEENGFYVAEFINVPKVLADLFESLIAAIYLDCNRDLNVVWTILYRLWEKEINKFCNNVPTNPVFMLYKSKLQPIFSEPTDKRLDEKTEIQLKIHSNNKSLTVYGLGTNKKEAKIAAAKMALKNLKKMS